MFTRIVVGSDGGPEARDAIVLGARIAAATGAGLTVVAVYPTSLFPAPGYSDRRSSMREAERHLAADRERYAPDALIRVVAGGAHARALRHYAESWKADLVIVGSARYAASGAAAISRTGRELLTRAPFAVGVAARGIHEREFSLEHVGVGYDTGRESEIALAFAAEIAAGASAELEVMAVVDDGVPAVNAGEWLTMSSWDERLEADRAEVLELGRLAVRELPGSPRVEAVLAEPRGYLRDRTDDLDLMVIGSRRWGTLARVVLGGVGETLTARSGCSLIVTRRPESEPASTASARVGTPAARG